MSLFPPYQAVKFDKQLARHQVRSLQELCSNLRNLPIFSSVLDRDHSRYAGKFLAFPV